VLQWVLLVLMVVGPTAGGAGGGIKVTALAAVGSGVRRSLRGDVVRRATGIAVVWIGAYAALVFVALLALIAAQPQVPADRLLFLAISAASNVGLAHEPVAMAGAPLIVLSATMLLGRILPIAIVWWQAATTSEADVPIG
jgi:Trk-type K+ transport system membrane component